MYQRLKRLRGKVVPVYLVITELIDSWWNTGWGSSICYLSERRHRRLVGRNIENEVDLPGSVAIEWKRGFENTAHV